MRRRKARVLFSARDPGAVGHLLALSRAFRRSERFEVLLTASGVAAGMLREKGEAPTPFAFSSRRDFVKDGEDAGPLMDAATKLLSEVRPDAVIASLSSAGSGVDEALLAVAQVPTFAMQDFWGDVNLSLGVPAGLYFVHDQYAVRLTRQRWGVPGVAVGSPKHSLYADFDLPMMRRSGRQLCGAVDGDRVLGFFGQSSMIPGHESTYCELVAAVANLKPQPLFLIREHPKATDLRHEHLSFARQHGLNAVDVTGRRDAETWLAACDIVVTSFSLCGLDHAYLSAFSAQPIGSVVYLMTNSHIRAYATEFCGMIQLPIVEDGIGQFVESPSGILPALGYALTDGGAAAYFKASKKLRIDDPCNAVMRQVIRSLSMDAHDDV